MDANQQQREETKREREQIQATITENRRFEEEQATRLRDQNVAYRSDLRGQIDYNRRQRSLQVGLNNLNK